MFFFKDFFFSQKKSKKSYKFAQFFNICAVFYTKNLKILTFCNYCVGHHHSFGNMITNVVIANKLINICMM